MHHLHLIKGKAPQSVSTPRASRPEAQHLGLRNKDPKRSLVELPQLQASKSAERGTRDLRVCMHLHRAAPMPGRQAAAAVAAVVDDVLEAVHEEGDTAEADAEAETEGPGAVGGRGKIS